MSATSGEPLVIRSLEFIGGMASVAGWRPESSLPEIAFAGRSNVGKSSLLNRLIHRKKMARVSNTPGRTREVNFFRVNDAFILVDLPGYGYARVSKEKRAEWRPLIEGFMRSSEQLRGIGDRQTAERDVLGPRQLDGAQVARTRHVGGAGARIVVRQREHRHPALGRALRDLLGRLGSVGARRVAVQLEAHPRKLARGG